MHLGKKVRMERFFNRHTGRSIIVPMDHGVTVGPIPGLTDMRTAVNNAAEGGADAVLMHKGLVRCSHRGSGRDVGLIVHLSASTALSPFANAKTLVGSVEEALRLGADGVSVHVNIGDEDEKRMLADFGRIAAAADDWGMPLLAMVYARGPKINNEYDPQLVAHCARVGVELGADVVKVAYTGDMESFAVVVEACCIPVLIAGGAKMESNRDILQMVHDSLRAGGGGISLGRNVFQHARPERLLKALRGLVHEDWNVEQALALVESDA
ncbi:2-amino-3,7-dideoxy-D-threo-hept-6-ulosonate synthase [Desulfovibrio sp. OttesenSCG-928-A18]|nr:2-amino-3,7-dideoxy-D-threo-hept-6-ulosonate synthase [Desulfovibrio sp. OttesenSCG-928-A18]